MSIGLSAPAGNSSVSHASAPCGAAHSYPALARRVRGLADKKTRMREECFVVEGMQPVWRAAESGWDVEVLAVSPARREQRVVAEMACALSKTGTRVVTPPDEWFTRLSDRDGPSGVLAIVRFRTRELRSVDVEPDDFWVILHRVHNPGNLGTIVRTADACGCAGVILAGDCTDPFSPRAVKASMGSLFGLPLVLEKDSETVLQWASTHRIPLVGACGTAGTRHWDEAWTRPTALVLGNEGEGLPAHVVDRMDDTVRIPMTGTAESLNLAVAAGVLMYEVQRNRIG